jgi:Domain of unknown function (DUF4340)
MIRSLGIHLGLLALATAFAARAWLVEDKPEQGSKVEIWGGSPDSIQSIEYTDKKRRVVLHASKDEQGRYFVADVTREAAPGEYDSDPHGSPHKYPDAPPDHGAPPGQAAEGQAPDGQPPDGQGGAAGAEPKADAPAEPPPMKTERFIAVKEVGKLTERFAPLLALRSLGKVEPARYAEFGFDADEPARIKLQLGSGTRELLLGGKTPGGQDVYVRTVDGEQAYVVDGNIARDLETAESRLMERALHAWESDDALKVKITLGEQARELGRSPEKKSFWSDPNTLEEKDETATNWMTKLERLRVIEYFEKVEPPPEPVLHVEYYSEKGKLLGRLELATKPPEAGKPDAKPEYLVRTEHTRWWGQVVQSTGEQLAQDATGVVQR